MKKIIAVLALFAGSASLEAQTDLLNLPSTTTDRINKYEYLAWPANYGDAHVCLWEDNKQAAVTITIDDNIPNDHDWWLSMGDTYGFKFTWCVIVYPYMYDYDESVGTNRTGFGDMTDFQRLYNAGHSIQGHGSTVVTDLGGAAIEKDYNFTKYMLEKYIPGNRVLAYAYPGGDMYLPAAETLFATCRGVHGSPNEAGKIPYMNVNSNTLNTCWINSVLSGDGSTCTESWQQSSAARYIYGWLDAHYHTVSDKAGVESLLQLLYANRDKLWVGAFVDVGRYGQSRDTHTLTVNTVTTDLISFNLTDRMDDTWYDYPLTVKVRVDTGWDTCHVTQNSVRREARILENQGDRYVLVKAVPDRGEVVISKLAVSFTPTPVISPAAGAAACSVNVSISCSDGAADIYYTTDGSDPDNGDALYNGSFTLRTDATVKARAYNGTDDPSRVAGAAYTIETTAADPVITYTGDSNTGLATVSMSCSTPGAVIRYTTDGNDPTASSPAYSSSLTVGDSTTVKARAYHSCLAASGVASVQTIIYDTDPDLLCRYDFDGNVADQSGHGNDGTLVGGPSYVTGVNGQGLQLSGSGQYVDGADIDFASGPFTITAWFRTTSVTAGPLLHKISASNNQNYYLYPGTAEGAMAGLYDGSGWQEVSSGSGNTFNDGVWHQCVMVVTTGTVEIFVDTVSFGTVGHDNTIPTNDVNFLIGKQNNTSNCFTGSVDDFRMYGRALTQAEISGLYRDMDPVSAVSPGWDLRHLSRLVRPAGGPVYFDYQGRMLSGRPMVPGIYLRYDEATKSIIKVMAVD